MRDFLFYTLLVLQLVFFTKVFATAENLKIASNSCWRIESTKELKRWVIVHKFDEKDKLFHIEVLERKRHSKPWEFKRLSAHMAITQKALEESLQQLLPADLVYPESFDSAYESWKNKSPDKQEICSTTVIECLESKPKPSNSD